MKKGEYIMANMNKLEKLFDELVPENGAAQTVAGEIVRAAMRLNYRWYNDGDMPGTGYGNETCNAPARYLMEVLPEAEAKTVSALWGCKTDAQHELLLGCMTDAVVAYIEADPGLKEQANSRDMLECTDPHDRDYYYEDEEDDDYYDDCCEDEYEDEE